MICNPFVIMISFFANDPLLIVKQIQSHPEWTHHYSQPPEGMFGVENCPETELQLFKPSFRRWRRGGKTTCAPSPKETPWAALTSWKRTMFMLWKSDFWALAVSVFYTIITQIFKTRKNRQGERFFILSLDVSKRFLVILQILDLATL